MPALSFKKQFVHNILSGEKRQTIRTERKRPIKLGDKLYLYTGMRTKQCMKIFETRCLKVEDIEIYSDADEKLPWYNLIIKIDGAILNSIDRRNLMEADGFYGLTKWERFFEFFSDSLPFKGQIIHW